MSAVTATDADLSVVDLAAEAGTTVRTVRYYQSEGLLPAPERHGRQARYRAEHLDRLRLITRLQDQGLRLSAIADLLAGTDEATATGWLGLGEMLTRPWADDAPELLSDDDLDARLDGLPEATRAELLAAGLIERRADTTPVVYLVPSPGLLGLALDWVRLGLDPEVGFRLQARLRQRLRDTATELVADFTDQVSLDHLAGAGPGSLAELLDRVRPITRRAADLLFAHEMERAQRNALDAAVADPTDPTAPKGTAS